MMVLIGNHSTRALHMAKAYPGKIGWIMGPSHFRKPHQGTPYALDNDAYISWSKQQVWDENAWFRMLVKAEQSDISPLWCLIPDVVANRDSTLKSWEKYQSYVSKLGWDRAFAVQDGMTVGDVPKEADVVFVGGTTSWKWRTVPLWCANFPRVHVGRCAKGKVLTCEKLGAESCDSSGWFRDTQNGYRVQWLEWWLEGHIKPDPELDFSTAAVPPSWR